MKTGIELIAAERERQISAEGYSPEHDDAHREGSLAKAAVCYATPHEERICVVDCEDVPLNWPWDDEWWKPEHGNRVRELVKAGALLAAEIDRLQRLENKEVKQ